MFQFLNMFTCTGCLFGEATELLQLHDSFWLDVHDRRLHFKFSELASSVTIASIGATHSSSFTASVVSSAAETGTAIGGSGRGGRLHQLRATHEQPPANSATPIEIFSSPSASANSSVELTSPSSAGSEVRIDERRSCPAVTRISDDSFGEEGDADDEDEDDDSAQP